MAEPGAGVLQQRRPGDQAEAGQAAAGHEICTALTNYWLARGPLRDVRLYLESLLPLAQPDSLFRASAPQRMTCGY